MIEPEKRRCDQTFGALRSCYVVRPVPGCAQSSNSVASSSVVSADIPGPGHVLADGAGYTLYIFTPDLRGSSKCYSVCANDWPPLLQWRGTPRRWPRHRCRPPRHHRGKERFAPDHVRPLASLPLLRRRARSGDRPGEDMGTWYLLSTSGEIDRQPVTGSSKS